MTEPTKKYHLQVVSDAVHKLEPPEQKLVLVWAKKAAEICSDQSLTKTKKLELLSKLETSEVIKTLILKLAREAKLVLWDNRNWPSRLALSGLALGVGVAGVEAAGIAAMGTAVGVPVFLLTSAGGALLGTIVQELTKDENNSDD